MIDKFMNIKKEDLDFCFHLIGHSFFDKGAGNLDYLHLVRQPGYLQFPFCRVKTLEESYRKYEEHIPIISPKLLDFFLNTQGNSFIPQAILKPPTNRPELQEPLFSVFREAFSDIDDLSGCLLKNISGEGVNKFSLSRNIEVDLTKIERILIIDDVYAEGNAIASVMLNLGQNKSFVAICPLVLKLEENQLYAKLRHATDKIMKKLKFK